MKKFAIIVAAGAGKRFNAGIPKQFELLCGKPLLMHSLQAFFEAEPDISVIAVIPVEFVGKKWEELCDLHDFRIPHETIEGGPERFHSVKNGLSLIHDDGLVAVHDAARPLVTRELIRNAFKMAGKYEAVIPVVPVSDSVRVVEGAVSRPVDRKKLRLIQTPQVFSCSLLKKAYLQQYDIDFTDDASVVEANGKNIVLIDGHVENIKVTRPVDLVIAEAIINARKATHEFI